MDESTAGWGEIFDALKAKEGLTSDAQLAATLNKTRAYICSVRKHRKGVSSELGQEIYERLGIRIGEEDIGLFMPARVQQKAGNGRPNARTRFEVFRRANGFCELCTNPAPFTGLDGQPYLEIHRIVPVQCGGKNTAQNLVALCPNCHKKMEIVPQAPDLKLLTERATRLKSNSGKVK